MKKIFTYTVTSALLFAVCTKSYAADSHDKTKPPNQAATLPNQYSDEAVHKFWDIHLNKIVMEELVGAKYPIPEINARYKLLMDRTMRRYGKPYSINASPIFSEDSPYIIGGSTMHGNEPVIVIFVPAMMNVYRELQSTGDPSWQAQFEIVVVSNMLHELDHIAGGTVGTPTQSRQQLIREEANAWAETIEHTFSVFVGLGYPLPPGDAAFYNAWASCGRKIDPCWESFIGANYGAVAKKYRE